MNRYNELVSQFGYCEGLVGENENGDSVIVTIDKYSASIRTLQKNNWIRENIYHRDGTEEELYKR